MGRRFRNAFFATLLFTSSASLQPSMGAVAPGMIETVAGGADPYDFLSYPSAVAVDPAGNVLIADSGSSRVRKVAPTGEVTTLAGTGSFGFSGDGGPARRASLNSPQGLAVDGSGNVFIADTGNHRIRVVDRYGNISTLAGTGACVYSGDGGPASTAGLCFPNALAIDPFGDLYVADTYNSRIRKIEVILGIASIRTVAGDGTPAFRGDGLLATKASLKGPYGIAFNSDGDLFIADTHNHRIRKVSVFTGVIGTVVGDGFTRPDGYGRYGGDGGQAHSASLNLPKGLFIDPSGAIWIADTENHRVRRRDPSGQINTVIGNGGASLSPDGAQASTSSIGYPSSVVRTSSGTFVAETGNMRVRLIGPDGRLRTIAGTGAAIACCRDNGKLFDELLLRLPMGLAVDAGGVTYVADTFNHRIIRVDPGGAGVMIAGDGTSGSSGDGGPASGARLSFPQGLVLGDDGSLYVADTGNHRVRRIWPSGQISTHAGDGRPHYEGDGGPATQASLYLPTSLAFDSAGNLFVSDTFGYRIRRVDRTGTIITVAGMGVPGSSGDSGPARDAKLDLPFGIATDRFNNLFIADTYNHKVRRISSGADGIVDGDVDEVITTVAGDGFKHDGRPEKEAYRAGHGRFTGEGGPATAASLNFPRGIVVDTIGNVYVSDSANCRVRQVTLDGRIQTIAGGDLCAYTGTYLRATIADPRDAEAPDIADQGFTNPEPGLSQLSLIVVPTALYLGATDDVYLAETYGGRIRRIAGPQTFAPRRL